LYQDDIKGVNIMVEHLKNFGVGIVFVAIIVACSLALHMVFQYIGSENVLYLFVALFVTFITYTFGSLARTILFDKNKV
jgi:hypothetical protein